VVATRRRDRLAALREALLDPAFVAALAALRRMGNSIQPRFKCCQRPETDVRRMAGFEQIVVIDTIPLRAGTPDSIKVLSCAELLTDSIRSIFSDRSVSDVFGGENQLF